MNKITKKSAIKVHKHMLTLLSEFEISERKYFKLTNKLKTLAIAIPVSANDAVEKFVNTTLKALVFTDERDINEIQKQRRAAKTEWCQIVDNHLRDLVVD